MSTLKELKEQLLKAGEIDALNKLLVLPEKMQQIAANMYTTGLQSTLKNVTTFVLTPTQTNTQNQINDPNNPASPLYDPRKTPKNVPPGTQTS